MTELQLHLSSAWYFLPTDDGVEIGSTLRRKRFMLRGETGHLIAALQALMRGVDRLVPVDALTETGLPHASAAQLVAILQRLGALIETRRTPPGAERFDRQQRFFQFFERDGATAAELDRRLRDRKVLIVGLGSYGTWLALQCARMGLREIVAIDPDTVELSNLSRQALYVEGDVGRKKVDAFGDRLRTDSPDTRFVGVDALVTSAADLDPWLDGVDLVFNSFGYRPSRIFATIARASGARSIPFLSFGASWTGPLTLPGKTACPECFLSRGDVRRTVAASLDRWFHDPHNGGPVAAILAPRAMMTATTAAWEAARFLSTLDEAPTLRGVVTMDPLSYDGTKLRLVARDPQCPMCRDWHYREERTA